MAATGLARAAWQLLHQIVPTNGHQGSGQICESVAGFEPLPDPLRLTTSVEAGRPDPLSMLRQELARFAGGRPLDDDLTLALVRRL